MGSQYGPLVQAFEATYGHLPAVIAEAPGRVNIIGEHTDYNEGLVLPVAIGRKVRVAVRPDPNSSIVRAHSLDFDEADEFDAASPSRLPGHSWRNYVRGVCWALTQALGPLPGAHLLLTGDVPQGAGLSSSAALEVAVAGAMVAAAGGEISRKDLALLCQRAENEFVGVRCGIMDQMAAALGRKGNALLIDCRTLEAEPVPLPHDITVAVVDSKVRRRLVSTAYNRRREECAEAARKLGVPSLRDLRPDALERARSAIPPVLYRRARHVVSENARVLGAVQAMRRDDAAALGLLLYESHESLRRDFEVSCPELDLLVALAQRLPAVLGARLTGAGFGGCTVNLLRPTGAGDFCSFISREYTKATGLEPAIYICEAEEGLTITHV
jgi:galactokinase